MFYGTVFPNIGTPTGFLEWATCGGIYALGTVVPGVSSSCILISMNAYEAVLSVLGGENFAAILPLLVGFSVVAVGLVCIVNTLYTKSEATMQAAVCGFVAASIFPVVPPFQADKTGMLSLLLGLLASFAITEADKTKIIEQALAHHCQMVQLAKPHFDRAMVERAHAEGLRCNVFWSDDPDEAKRFLDMGIDPILTNDYQPIAAATGLK